MKIVRYLLTILIAILLAFIWVFPQFFSCLFVAYDDFDEVKEGIFIEKILSKKQSDSLLLNVLAAKKRVSGFWGKQFGVAKIICCKNATTYQKYCQSSEGAGCSIGTPLGSWIILNTDGLNTDVIAHEMCHNELMTRVGWWKTKQHIPTWFDEGLALMLDRRFVSSQDSIQRYIDYQAELRYLSPRPIPLTELTTQKAFFGQNELFTKIAYFSSAMAVSKKISIKGKREIIRIVEQTKNEGKFDF